MSVPIPDFTHSRPVRQSLARGVARETLRRARSEDADVAGTIRALGDLAPNRKAAERTIGRVRRGSGVVLAGRAAGQEARVVMVLRSAPEVTFRDLTDETFTEGSIIYTRIEGWAAKGTVFCQLHRVTISPHALQRLVERSLCPLGSGLLATVDTEVRPLLRAIRAAKAEVGDKFYIRSDACEGLWIGCLGESSIDESWGLMAAGKDIPTLAIRTFLGEEHMSPANYLRWKGDPTLTVQ